MYRTVFFKVSHKRKGRSHGSPGLIGARCESRTEEDYRMEGEKCFY